MDVNMIFNFTLLKYTKNIPRIMLLVCTSLCLTHWGRVTHICVSRLTITGSDDRFSPGRCQAIIWTNARILLIGPLGTNFSENLIEILAFSLKKMRLKVSSAKLAAILSRPQCVKYQSIIPISFRFTSPALGDHVITHVSVGKLKLSQWQWGNPEVYG